MVYFLEILFLCHKVKIYLATLSYFLYITCLLAVLQIASTNCHIIALINVMAFI